MADKKEEESKDAEVSTKLQKFLQEMKELREEVKQLKEENEKVKASREKLQEDTQTFMDDLHRNYSEIDDKLPEMDPVKTKEIEIEFEHPTDPNKTLIKDVVVPEEPTTPKGKKYTLPDDFRIQPGLTKQEQEVFDALNLARTKPKEVAKWIEDNYLKYYKKELGGFELPEDNGVILKTREKDAAFRNAVAFLKKQKPIPPFELQQGMIFSSRDHVLDLGPRYKRGHAGTDGTKPAIRMNFYGTWSGKCGENIGYARRSGMHVVAGWVIDDGMPQRRHRKNVFNPKWLVCGVGTGPHAKFKKVTVVDLAHGYTGKPLEEQQKIHRRRALKLHRKIPFSAPETLSNW